MTERVGWDELPGKLRASVERRTGRVLAAEVVKEGLNCAAALVITTERRGRLFLKGIRESAVAETIALQYELALNRTVGGISPTILHSVHAAGWHCVLVVHVPGRHVDLSPGTRDLPAVTTTLQRMARLRPPHGVTVPPLAARFAAHLAPGDADLLAGDTLLHTDANPHNILISSEGGTAYVIDWAMAASGPAWVDAAYTAVRMMECDQPVDDALGWLSTMPSWQRADPKAVRVFVEAVCRHWTASIGTTDAEWSNECYRRLCG